jgi:hypothetical protein
MRCCCTDSDRRPVCCWQVSKTGESRLPCARCAMPAGGVKVSWLSRAVPVADPSRRSPEIEQCTIGRRLRNGREIEQRIFALEPESA